MLDVIRNNIAVLIGTHGNEMEIGGRLAKKLEIASIQGVRYRIAHPDAVKAKVRYLGRTPDAGELMGRYPGRLTGDPEERAAKENLKWLEEVEPIVVFDIHETTTPVAYFATGKKTSLAAIASAKALGYTSCIVEGDTFYQSVPNGVAVENSLADNEPDATAETLYDGLKTLASTNLEQLAFNPTVSGLVFYQKFTIPTLDSDGNLTLGLKELEEIDTNPRFSPLDITEKQRELLKIPAEANVVYGTWGHDNMSRQDPKLFGLIDNRVPRREYFGSFLIQIAPPNQTDDGFVVFEEETRGLLRMA